MPVVLLFAIEVADGNRADELTSIMEDFVKTLDGIELVSTRKAGGSLNLRTDILDQPAMYG